LVAIVTLAMPTPALHALSKSRSKSKSHDRSKSQSDDDKGDQSQANVGASKNNGETDFHDRIVAPPYVLLIANPSIYDKPAPDAPSHQSHWRAGLRLAMLQHQPDSKAAPATAAMSGWFQVAPYGLESKSLDGWMPGAFLAPPPQRVERADMDAIGKATVDGSHGIPPEYEPKDLAPVGPGMDKSVDYRLRREAAGALAQMIAAAKADGVKFRVVSAYRSWAKQQELYQRKIEHGGWSQNAIARPGHSEHQLGLAVDLNGDDPKTAAQSSFGATAASRWLLKNAPRFGFAISFTRHNQPQTGIAPEPWHYRYWGRADAPVRHAAALGEAVLAK
jgi:LAS superfamily LD-carboxypeptidase LdcB